MAKRYVYDGTDLKRLDAPISFMTPLLPDNVDPATTGVTAITCVGSASPNQFSTPGSWVEIDASLSADAAGIMFTPSANVFSSGVNTSTLIQIGTGAAAAETVWATVCVSQLTTSPILYIPGYIAAGTRVSVRVFSAAQTSKSASIKYTFASGSNISAPTTYNGASPASNAQGVSVPWSGAVNTEGDWTEIVASTTDDIDVIGLFVGTAGDAATGNAQFQVDVGYGAASSEVALAEHVTFTVGTAEQLTPQSVNAFQLPETIPAGSRLVARLQTGTGASVSAVDVTLVTAKKP